MLNAPQRHEIIDLLSCAAGRLPFHNTQQVHSRVSISVSVTVLAATHLIYINKVPLGISRYCIVWLSCSVQKVWQYLLPTSAFIAF